MALCPPLPCGIDEGKGRLEEKAGYGCQILLRKAESTLEAINATVTLAKSLLDHPKHLESFAHCQAIIQNFCHAALPLSLTSCLGQTAVLNLGN